MLLALDTATRLMSLALHDGYRLHFEATWHTPNNHSIELTPAIQRAFAQVQITPADLAAVAVSLGPGSFTGLRIGLSTAKGLALAQNFPLVGVPTLDIVAYAVPAFEGRLVAVLQAGRGRVCAQGYRWSGPVSGWAPTGQAEITTWAALVDGVEEPTLFAGEIDDNGQALLAESTPLVHVAPGAWGLRRAGFLAEIAWARLRTGQTDDPALAAPIYLHQPGVPHP
ncbi:MAG: tRNA (adenosine(37)-N6)-threonylcarbamoyltransferase complex dimerization subunit type 1 TsaB [Chloroflexi bacterium]|nr:tRNA (adenosine(37)-N6)-threonylcarbamoyltransferase complex dimerization subunit type 1 TsaB [Chloroflexota bacterium]